MRKWTPEFQREYLKQWRANNKDKLEAYKSDPKNKARAREMKKRLLRTDPEWRAKVNARRAAYHKKNRDQILATQRAKRSTPEYKAKRLLWEYGITAEALARMREEQGNACAICLRCLEGLKVCIDHCHKTGQLRGLLCGWCNSAIGLLQDDKENLQRAIAYLIQDRPVHICVNRQIIARRATGTRQRCRLCDGVGHNKTACPTVPYP
jgi:hypothetical protein